MEEKNQKKKDSVSEEKIVDDLKDSLFESIQNTSKLLNAIIEKIDTSNKKTQCIILCPTRELCIQITKDIQAYAKYERDLRITPVYGGSNIQTQIKSLNSGSQIVVGTPGRVIDLIKRGKLKLKNIEYLVLDEADEMLNMGFKDDIDFILAETPLEKQTKAY